MVARGRSAHTSTPRTDYVKHNARRSLHSHTTSATAAAAAASFPGRPSGGRWRRKKKNRAKENPPQELARQNRPNASTDIHKHTQTRPVAWRKAKVHNLSSPCALRLIVYAPASLFYLHFVCHFSQFRSSPHTLTLSLPTKVAAQVKMRCYCAKFLFCGVYWSSLGRESFLLKCTGM